MYLEFNQNRHCEEQSDDAISNPSRHAEFEPFNSEQAHKTPLQGGAGGGSKLTFAKGRATVPFYTLAEAQSTQRGFLNETQIKRMTRMMMDL